MIEAPCDACVALHGESSSREAQHLELVGVVMRNNRPFEEHYECPSCGASLSRPLMALPEASVWFMVDGTRQ
ncbi:hypothetical protein WJ24_27705 [Burkholderia vietnamiensis]|uniref:hypothetical protein n=1 Tax=Burkholderia vietnamiensis TaxID=60552 RepID=UPI00075D473C|nr:hypothetical protein [Burkholderia vietnamiensis]KVG05415.1 hypothetical protein WJ24_27705 [Burkholderia vietnamiensis]KVR85874.1 hypothetical protein WK27_15090 [Burkholderia vietnamiensis]MCA8073085.1 hypothetical protein [Burkholderia vietnamiensis]